MGLPKKPGGTFGESTISARRSNKASSVPDNVVSRITMRVEGDSLENSAKAQSKGSRSTNKSAATVTSGSQPLAKS